MQSFNSAHWHFPIHAGFYISFRNTTWNVFEVYSVKNVTIVQKVPNESETGVNYYTLLRKDARRSNFRNTVMVGVSMVRFDNSPI